MLRQSTISCLNRVVSSRYLTTAAQPKDDKKSETEWSSAKPYSEIPGPSAFTLIRRFLPGGVYHNISVSELQTKLQSEYGQLAKLPGSFNQPDTVFAYDPRDIETVYRTEGQWPARRAIETLTYYRHKVRPDIFKNMCGLVSEQGENWAKIRSTVNPVMLSPKTVKTYIPYVDEVAREFLQLSIQTRDANNEMPVNFGEQLNKWALESISVIALDQRLGVLSGDDPDAKLLIQSIRNFFELSYQLDILPSMWRIIETPKFRQLMNTYDIMTDLTLKYVDKAILKLEANEKRQDLDWEPSVLEKLLKKDRHAAVVMAMDMLFGGVDTTSSSLVGLLYHIAMNPEKQERLREEIFQILPTVDSKLTAASLNNIPYMRACIKEAMRLSPVVSGNIRSVGQNLVLQGYQIPKGKDVVFAGIYLQQSNDQFPQSDKFIPERWLKNIPQSAGCPSAKTAHPFSYMPFGFGPRACIGKRFAEMEVEIMMARILRQYRLEWNYPPIKYVSALIEVPVSELKFKLTELDVNC